jgi:hypothetical protein
VPNASAPELQTLEEHEKQVRELAYLKWEQAGYPESDGVQFWLEAENEVLAASK